MDVQARCDNWADAMTVTFDADTSSVGGDDEPEVTWCSTCRCLSSFAPDQNEDNGLPVCTWCGCLMDGAADYT